MFVVSIVDTRLSGEERSLLANVRIAFLRQKREEMSYMSPYGRM